VDGQVQRLEKAMETMVNIISKRKDGRKFVPVVLRLEREIAALRDEDQEFKRILNLAAASTI
jgi:translation initiation factor 1 (eIF-1/SUI1)